MRKLMVVVFVVVGIVSVGYSYEMPEDVKRFLDNYVKDSTADGGRFLRYKKEGIIPASVQFNDLRLRALQVYYFKMIFLDETSLNEYPDTVALSEIIMPTNQWRVLVMAHNKPLYEFMLVRRNGELRFSGGSFPSPGSSFRCSMWEPLLESYPESTGINPVFVIADPFRSGFNSGFLYFPQKGPRKVYYIKRGYGKPERDTLAALFSGSIKDLDDSKKFIAHRRKYKQPPKAPKLKNGGQ